LLSFGISWGSYLIKTIAHIESGSLGLLIFSVTYLSGPAVATFITQRIIYKQGFRQYGWSLDKKDYKWFLYTPLLFIALILMIFGVIAVFGNTHIDSPFGQLDFSQRPFNYQFIWSKKIYSNILNLPPIPSWLYFMAIIGVTVIVGSTVCVPIMFGEELGWRGLMLKETQRLGFFASNFLIGITWGLWHLPLILHGGNYPNHPYFGVLMMCIMAAALSPIMAYVRLKTKSLLGTCMLHGMIDASKPVFAFYVIKSNELYSSPVGWAGLIAFIFMVLLICVFDRKFVTGYARM